MRASALSIGILVALLLILGCGSSSEGSGGGGGEASAQEVDAECKAANKKVAAELLAVLKATKPNSEQEEIHMEVTKWVPSLIANAEAQVVALESLEIPEGDEAEVNQILDAYRKWMVQARATPFKVVVANDVYEQARKLAKKYGLAECAEDPFEVMRQSS